MPYRHEPPDHVVGDLRRKPGTASTAGRVMDLVRPIGLELDPVGSDDRDQVAERDESANQRDVIRGTNALGLFGL
jgi:hypothetical protein